MRKWLLPGMVQLALLLPGPSYAVNEYKANFGIVTGVSFPSSSSFVFSYGAEFAWLLRNSIYVGAYYQGFSLESDLQTGANRATFTSDTRIYSTFMEYLFDGQLRGFSVGLRSGILTDSGSANAASEAGATVTFDDASTHFFFAPKIGYDVFFGRLSLGGEASSVYSFGKDGPDVFSVMAVGKIWF